MRNIDSTFDSRTHKRVVTVGIRIRKLRLIDRFSSFSAAWLGAIWVDSGYTLGATGLERAH